MYCYTHFIIFDINDVIATSFLLLHVRRLLTNFAIKLPAQMSEDWRPLAWCGQVEKVQTAWGQLKEKERSTRRLPRTLQQNVKTIIAAPALLQWLSRPIRFTLGYVPLERSQQAQSPTFSCLFHLFLVLLRRAANVLENPR